MKKIFVIATIFSAAFQIALAQKAGSEENETTKSKKELYRELRQEIPSRTNAASVTVEEVGEPDSFGRNAKFLGIAASGGTIVYTSCDPAVLLNDLGVTLGADDRCLAVTNPALTTAATFTDMARITIPGRSVSDIIYTVNNHTITWDFTNELASNIFGQMSYSPRITIESVALNDPAAIDPATGLPMNGSFTTTGNGTKFLTRTLTPGFFESNVDTYTRANTTGFSRQYFRDLGLPETVINRLYRNPITIRLGMRVLVRGITSGQFVYTARFLGV